MYESNSDAAQLRLGGDFTSFLLVAAASCSSCMAYPSSSLSVVDNGKDEL